MCWLTPYLRQPVIPPQVASRSPGDSHEHVEGLIESANLQPFPSPSLTSLIDVTFHGKSTKPRQGERRKGKEERKLLIPFPFPL